MSKDKHPVADAFAHLAAVMHECDIAEMPQLVFRSKTDQQKVLWALQKEAGGDPAHADALMVIGMAPRFYNIEIDYPRQKLA